MHIFNLIKKNKYIVALVLLVVFSFFIILTHVGEIFVEFEDPSFSVGSNTSFDYADVRTTSLATRFFGRYRGVKALEQWYSTVRQTKILPMSKFVPEKHINNIYTTVRAPYYTEMCKLLAQLIVIYIFISDGKKRLLKL